MSECTGLAPATVKHHLQALEAVTKSLAKEPGPRKIRVNTINPGLAVTEGTTKIGVIGSDFEKNAVAATPLGRAGQPEDIAPPASFIASEDARWIMGETIFVSGGARFKRVV